MKILFLHLSDIHIEDSKTFNDDKVIKLNKAINTFENVDEAFILVSGDISQSGTKEQFDIFKSIIGRIYKNITQKNNLQKRINVLVVPGNHDIDFKNKRMSRNDIYKEAFTNDNHAQLTKEYILKMNDFFDFAAYNSCFVTNKIIDIKDYDFDGYKIKINLINTAIYSTFKDEIKDYDKGLHYLSNNDINVLKGTYNNEFIITLMHHSPDWFHEVCSHNLIEYINKYNSVLLCGHEHVNSENESKIDNNNVVKICGGPLSSGETSIFNAIILNTDSSQFKTYKFTWNSDDKVYDKIDGEEVVAERYVKLNNSFYTELFHDDLLPNCNDFRKFFVFPELLIFGDNEERISSLSKLNEKLVDKKIILINGDDYCGKTTLGKYLFLELFKNKIPVLFEMKKMNKHSINKIVSRTFREQYNSTEYSWSKFEQEDKNNKIAIIDDADKISKQEYGILLEELKKHFDKIIVLSGNRQDYDILELTKEYLDLVGDTIKIKICSIYNQNRTKLIQNVCKVLQPELTDLDVNNRVEIINRAIKKQISMFTINPNFIILFIKTMINSGYEMNEGNIFNSVFSSNITNMLSTNSNLDIQSTIFILQRIAYYIHVNKEYPLKALSFTKIIDEYNQEAGEFRNTINPTQFLTDVIGTRVLRYADGNGNICFANKSYLSYFVAKEWLRVQHKDVLEKMIRNVCFGINADILLFICFLYENAQNGILNVIIEKAEEFNQEFDVLNFLKKNIKFILQDKKEIVLSIPKKEDYIKAENEIDEQERRIDNKSKINYIDIYDYDESTITTQAMIFARGLKYIEIISKTLPDFIHSMDRSQIKKYVEDIYAFPNKLLYTLFKEIDDELINILSNDKFDQEQHLVESNSVNEYTAIYKTIRSLQEVSQLLILEIYHMAAKYAANKQTIKALVAFDSNSNINYKLQKAMFYDNLGATLEMGNILEDVYKHTDNFAIKNLAKRIFYKHILFNNISIKGSTQGHIDLFIPERNKKTVYSKNKKELINKIRIGKKK